jgi:hypothetical protein
MVWPHKNVKNLGKKWRNLREKCGEKVENSWSSREKSGVHPFKKWTPPLTVDVLAH